MKKAIIVLLIASMLVIGTVCFSACYSADPGNMKSLKGTYALDVYKIKTKDDPEWKDEKEEKKVEAYLVVTGEELGYYAYKIGNEPAVLESVHLNYEYDTDDTSLIRRVDYEFGYISDKRGYPCAGEESLIYNKKKKRLAHKSPTVSFSTEEGFTVNYTVDAAYKKANSATDLTYVKKKLGSKLNTPPRFETKNMDGIFISQTYYDVPEYPYIYYYIDIRTADMKADVYYAEKSDRVKHKISDLSVTYKKDKSNNTATITVGEQTFTAIMPEPVSGFKDRVTVGSGELTYPLEREFHVISRKNMDIEQEIDERLGWFDTYAVENPWVIKK